MYLCKYKDLFGKPNEDSHSYRIPIINLASIDVILTIIGGYAISYYFEYSFWIVLVILVIMSIIIHRIFCVNTTLNKVIFGKV